MADSRDGHAKTIDPAAEVEQLRARIKELEDQLRSGGTPDGEPQRSATGGGSGRILTGALAATTALMAAPAFITVRRWIRWWL